LDVLRDVEHVRRTPLSAFVFGFRKTLARPSATPTLNTDKDVLPRTAYGSIEGTGTGADWLSQTSRHNDRRRVRAGFPSSGIVGVTAAISGGYTSGRKGWRGASASAVLRLAFNLKVPSQRSGTSRQSNPRDTSRVHPRPQPEGHELRNSGRESGCEWAQVKGSRRPSGGRGPDP